MLVHLHIHLSDILVCDDNFEGFIRNQIAFHLYADRLVEQTFLIGLEHLRVRRVREALLCHAEEFQPFLPVFKTTFRIIFHACVGRCLHIAILLIYFLQQLHSFFPCHFVEFDGCIPSQIKDTHLHEYCRLSHLLLLIDNESLLQLLV